MTTHQQKIDQAQRYYNGGNFAAARRIITELKHDAPDDPEVISKMSKLKRAMETDKWTLTAFALTGFLLIYLTVTYLF